MPSNVTNVILSGPVMDYLDGQLIAIRQKSGAALNRSKLLRGIVAGVISAEMNFSLCRTEREIAGLLGFLFKTWRDRR